MMAQTHIVVTGASGFIGSRLAKRLLSDTAFEGARFTFSDLSLQDHFQDPRVRVIEGDFADTDVRSRLLADGASTVFHLASILGGAAEQNYPLSRRVNVDATLSLLEDLRALETTPRVVFASSIAVYGTDVPALIDDDTPTNPTMIYGAQKRMLEVVLEQFSARGWIDGLAIRLPGIVARPGADPRLKSSFMNQIFHAYAHGDDITLPVSPQGAAWMISVPACIDAFVHAGLVDRRALCGRRAFTLPAQRVVFSELVSALARAYPASGSTVSFEPIADIEAQFGRQPLLQTSLADGLGFSHDGDLDRLVVRALEETV
jgi:nucleoside-diphosphate-sugar epimerase